MYTVDSEHVHTNIGLLGAAFSLRLLLFYVQPLCLLLFYVQLNAQKTDGPKTPNSVDKS